MELKLSHAQAELLNLSLGYLKSMSLKCALDLGLADAISNNGEAMNLEQLCCAISLPPSKKSHLRRLMRLLTHCDFFIERYNGVGTEPVYDLTAQSRLAIQKDQSTSLFQLINLQLDNICVKPALHMGDWFMQEKKKTPIELTHGFAFWDLMSQSLPLSTRFNDAMVCSSSLSNDVIIKHGADIFDGVKSLIDVGGGKGAVAELVAKNFPHVKCTVLDLPHVVNECPNDELVKFVAGDMFQYIPPAEVVLLKWILHDWSDEDCIKILGRCKDAISSKKGGKVVVLEGVIGSASAAKSNDEPLLLFDMLMLALFKGAERDETEWKHLFAEAGFSSYEIKHSTGFISIIEIYP